MISPNLPLAPQIAQRARAGFTDPTLPQPVTCTIRVAQVTSTTTSLSTLRFEKRGTGFPRHLPGQHVLLAHPANANGTRAQFSISSSPIRDQELEVIVTRAWLESLPERVRQGTLLEIQGPSGQFFFSAAQHVEPIVLISAGSGIVPMLSILRFLADTRNSLPCTFLAGARSEADLLHADECRWCLQALGAGSCYVTSLTRPSAAWCGARGRITTPLVRGLVRNLAGSRYFLCGPGDMNASLTRGLKRAGVPANQIHSERFPS